jgi:uncharacterized protein YtpQ (UPF0354 family)
MSRLVALVCVIVVLLAGAARAERLSPWEFTEAVAHAIRIAKPPSATVIVSGPLKLAVRYASGRTTNGALDNAYRLYVKNPDRLDDIVHRYAAGLLAAPNDTPGRVIDRSRIVPVLKDRRWFETVRAARQAQGQAALEDLVEPFNDELTVVYAEDDPITTRFLTTRDDVGDRAALHDLAIANLKRILPKIEMRRGDSGIFLISAGGDYESSLLLIQELWSSGQIKVDGDIVVAVPAKDALLVTGSHNNTGIARMRALAAEIATGPYALTTDLFVHRTGKWVKFEGE